MARSVFTGQYEHFRELIIQARKKAGLTQVQLAQKLRRPQSFVSKYELGERRLDVIEFLEVSAALGIEAETFIKELRKQTAQTHSGMRIVRSTPLSAPHRRVLALRKAIRTE